MSMIETAEPGYSRRGEKSAAAFRTISEVAEELDVPQHVLRFWESKFTQIRPMKRGGGRRYYRPEDVGLLRRIRQLLYQEGYTIRGVQKLLRESPQAARSNGAPKRSEKIGEEKPFQALSVNLPPVELPPLEAGNTDPRMVLAEIREELLELRRLLTS